MKVVNLQNGALILVNRHFEVPGGIQIDSRSRSFNDNRGRVFLKWQGAKGEENEGAVEAGVSLDVSDTDLASIRFPSVAAM